ncbi:MAG: type II secretion system F family protein [Candidatus Aenigmatarchaeota archaeon]|nr:MAG: type II secretion system F family protein [Candidatus Aenigmarchaeota archaeon]
MEITKYFIEIISVIVGTSIILLNFFVFPLLVPEEIFELMQPMINMAGAMIAIVPPVLVFYTRYKENKEVETQFTVFITDFTEAIDSGMTLPLALKYCKRKDYGILSENIQAIASQVDWGVPFRETLRLFSKKVNSLPVKRAITTIIETYKVGGKISDTLKAVGESLLEINKIKAERSVSVQSQILTSYLIFFVFIFILVILQSFLIPALTPQSTPGTVGVAGMAGTGVPELFPPEIFINFIVIQGFFAGLSTGKMAEGSVIAGVKHSIVLTVVGYSIFSVASHVQFSFF